MNSYGLLILAVACLAGGVVEGSADKDQSSNDPNGKKGMEDTHSKTTLRKLVRKTLLDNDYKLVSFHRGINNRSALGKNTKRSEVPERYLKIAYDRNSNEASSSLQNKPLGSKLEDIVAEHVLADYRRIQQSRLGLQGEAINGKLTSIMNGSNVENIAESKCTKIGSCRGFSRSANLAQKPKPHLTRNLGAEQRGYRKIAKIKVPVNSAEVGENAQRQGVRYSGDEARNNTGGVLVRTVIRNHIDGTKRTGEDLASGVIEQSELSTSKADLTIKTHPNSSERRQLLRRVYKIGKSSNFKAGNGERTEFGGGVKSETCISMCLENGEGVTTKNSRDEVTESTRDLRTGQIRHKYVVRDWTMNGSNKTNNDGREPVKIPKIGDYSSGMGSSGRGTQEIEENPMERLFRANIDDVANTPRPQSVNVEHRGLEDDENRNDNEFRRDVTADEKRRGKLSRTSTRKTSRPTLPQDDQILREYYDSFRNFGLRLR